jgi:hypothetical protein
LLERYEIPLNAFSRRTTISAWAIRQGRAGVRSLSVTQENLIKVTTERIKAGRIWLRRKTRQRWDLEWINPPYRQSCAKNLSHCQGGLLPSSCPRNWAACGLSNTDWEAVEKIHQTYAEQ